MSTRKYEFSWDLLGDLKAGRPNLGPNVRVDVYRLMQYCIRDVVERRHGASEADSIFHDAGYLAGTHVYDRLLGSPESLGEFVASLQQTLLELGVGVLRLEESDPDARRLVLTVSEDLDCSGLPVVDYEACTFDEGFIAGMLDRFTGKRYRVKEIDCWCTGDRTCRFLAERDGE